MLTLPKIVEREATHYAAVTPGGPDPVRRGDRPADG